MEIKRKVYLINRNFKERLVYEVESEGKIILKEIKLRYNSRRSCTRPTHRRCSNVHFNP